MINTLSGLLPFTLMGFLFASMLFFLQWLHGVLYAWYGLIFFASGFLLCAIMWLCKLYAVADSPLRHRKLNAAMWLGALLAFAFSMTFIMIFMYYWLNEDGHVHGASASSRTVALNDDQIGSAGVATVFADVHLKGYRLPVRVAMNYNRYNVAANQPQTVAIQVDNLSDRTIKLRFLAKVAPSEAKAYLSYMPLHHEQTLTLAPNASQLVQYPLTLSDRLPLALQPFSLSHFLIGPDAGTAWQKMQGDIQLING